MRIQYDSYAFSKKELLKYTGISGLLCIAVNLLFYQSVWAFLLMVPITFYYLKEKKKQLIRARKQRLHYHFKDALGSLGAALRAGYSMENAIGEACGDMRRLYGDGDELTRELQYMQAQLRNRIPLEKLLEDFGERSRVEDIYNFSQILSAAKRTGGDVTGALEKSARVLEGKIEIKKEIDAAIAARKLEQKIMSIMPAGIIVYMQVTSPGFLDVLYRNSLGAGIMSGCLLTYLAAYHMGRKMVEIEI